MTDDEDRRLARERFTQIFVELLSKARLPPIPQLLSEYKGSMVMGCPDPDDGRRTSD